MVSHKSFRGNVFRISVGITILSVLLLAGGTTAMSNPEGEATIADSNSSGNSPVALNWNNETQAFLGLINNYRAQNGLSTLNVDTLLQASVIWMSNDLLTSCVAGNYACSHNDSTGRTFDKRLHDFGYPAGVVAAVGENIAWGYNGGITTAQQAFTAWRNSPGHNINMLKSTFTAIGISRSCNSRDCAWVTDFGSQVVQPFNESSIISYYRNLGANPHIVETTDLLKAADDWRRDIGPPGFISPITTQQLLSLADEWSRS